VKTVDRKELVEHYRQAQPLRFLVQQGRHLDHLEPKVLVVQQEQLAQEAQLGQLEEEADQVLRLQALEEQLASPESAQVERLAQIPMMEQEGLGCCGCRRPWLQLPEH
jgi:hypothetical protein